MKPRVSNWFVAPGPLLKNIHCMPISNLEKGLKKIGFNENEVNDILGNNWFNFYKGIN